MEPDAHTRASVPPQQLLLLGGAMLTVALGYLGWTQLFPTLPWDERLFRAFNLLGLSYDAPVGTIPPLALNAARFLAHAVAFYAFGSVVNNIFRERGVLFRAAMSRHHVVILGDAAEVPLLALNYRRGVGGARNTVVVVADLPAESSAQLGRQGVLVVPTVSPQSLRRVLKDAAVVVVAGSSDHETARLATRVERAAGDDGFPTTVVFDGRDITHQWNQGRAGSAICRSTQVAIATLREAPPREADRVSPPPIVIGQGTTAAEIVRRIVVGWQELGEQMAVYCLGPERDWIDDIEVGLAGRAHLTFTRVPLNQDCVLRAVADSLAEWTPPPPRKASSTGPTVVVALNDATTAFTLAVAVAGSHPNARVVALVDDAAVWQPRLVALGVRVRLVARNAQLTDPGVLAITAEQLLINELLDDASRWPPEIPTVFGTVRRPADGAHSGLDEQSPATRQTILRIAAAAEDILTAGGVAVRGGNALDDSAVILSPEELRAMAARIGDLVDDHQPDLPYRALELAARLPTLVARVGWAPHRSPSKHNLLSPREINELAPRAHEQYQLISARTNNATGSEVAGQSWDEVSAFEQESNRAQIVDAPAKLAAVSLSWRRSERPVLYQFNAEQVELLAEWEHRRWEHHQRRNGRPGHEWAKPWTELEDPVKEYDRDPIRVLPEMLARVGIEIYDPRPASATAADGGVSHHVVTAT